MSIYEAAFPLEHSGGYVASGITRREYYAAHALAVIPRLYEGQPFSADDIAKYAFMVADSMCKEAVK